MITEKFNGHKIVLFDSIENLPINRFQAFQVALSIDSGIGGDMESVGSHITMLGKYITSDKKEEALQQLANFQQSLIFVISNINPKHNAFACLVHSIDGQERTDISESGIKETLEILAKQKFTAGKIGQLLNTLKKKLLSELSTCFPSLSGKGKELEYYSKIKSRVIFSLRKIQGVQVDEKIAAIDDYLLRLLRPKSFEGTNGLEIAQKKQFETICSLISQHMNITEPQKLTVFGFSSRLEILKKQLNKK